MRSAKSSEHHNVKHAAGFLHELFSLQTITISGLFVDKSLGTIRQRPEGKARPPQDHVITTQHSALVTNSLKSLSLEPVRTPKPSYKTARH